MIDEKLTIIATKQKCIFLKKRLDKRQNERFTKFSMEMHTKNFTFLAGAGQIRPQFASITLILTDWHSG